MSTAVMTNVAERAEWFGRRGRLNVFRPQAFFVEPERSEAGTVVSVATILLTNRECPWRCIYCELWKNTTVETVPRGAIPEQIDFALAQLWRDELRESHSAQPRTRETRPSSVRQIKLYNAGSFFDRNAIPPEDFPAIADRVRRFERVIVECHPALVGKSAIQFQQLLQPSHLEVAVGLEIADDAILEKLNKRMTLKMFRRAAEFLQANDIAMRAFVILRPPFVRSDTEALAFAKHSIDFAFDCGATVVSVIPARGGTVELEKLAARGEFAPPDLATLEAILAYGLRLQRGRVFADLWDIQRLAECAACFDARTARLHSMNMGQNVAPAMKCLRCERPSSM